MADSRTHVDPARRLLQAFRAEEIAGLRLTTQARLIGLGVIIGWNVIAVPAPFLYYYSSVLFVFMLNSGVHYVLRKKWPERTGLSFLFASIDVILLILTFVFLNGHLVPDWPLPMLLRTSRFVYFFLIVIVVALSYSPKLTLWTGISSALGWSAVLLWVSMQPVSILPHRQQRLDAYLKLQLTPEFVDLGARVEEIVVLCIFTGFLSMVVWRSRRLVVQQAETAR